MVKGNNACRPTGATVTTLTYACGENATYLEKPGSKRAELARRLHARGCKKCAGLLGTATRTAMPTQVGNPAQVTKEIARELLASGSGVRVHTTLGRKIAPAVTAYNGYMDSRRPDGGVLDHIAGGVNSESVAHRVPWQGVVVPTA